MATRAIVARMRACSSRRKAWFEEGGGTGFFAGTIPKDISPPSVAIAQV
jgi:hypothetical protein